MVSAPFLPAAAAGIVYALASSICHQLPERSFHVAAVQLPVCARCLGIYVGAAIGAAGAAMHGPRSGAPRHRLRITALAMAPTLVTVLLEWAGVWRPSNVTRALAGVPLGAVVTLVVAGALATVHYGRCAPRPSTVPGPPPTLT
jgi:uncharacterized membrane protein